jgi:hypothetical protein
MPFFFLYSSFISYYDVIREVCAIHAYFLQVFVALSYLYPGMYLKMFGNKNNYLTARKLILKAKFFCVNVK